MSIELTKDSDYLICLLFKDYEERRYKGEDKFKAKQFGSSAKIHASIKTKWSLADLDETCRELDRAGLLDILYADDTCLYVSLSDAAIIYMEKRFKNGLFDVLDYIAKIKGGIPFL